MRARNDGDARAARARSGGVTARGQLEVIVDRDFELDPSAAVRFAGELRRSGAPEFVALLYERLARDDANAALSALSQVDILMRQASRRRQFSAALAATNVRSSSSRQASTAAPPSGFVRMRWCSSR